MPFYEYECSHCHYYVEVLQKINDPPLKKCPSCARMSLKKLVSAPVFRLKGSGWYETDFKTDQEHKRNLAGSEREPVDSVAPVAGGKDGKGEVKAGETRAGAAGATGAAGAASAGGGGDAPAKKASGTGAAAAAGGERAAAATSRTRRGRSSGSGAAVAAKRAAVPGRAKSRAKSTRSQGRGRR